MLDAIRVASTVVAMTDATRGRDVPLARRIGLRIRGALATADMTQEDLARATGKSQQWVSRRITGATPVDASDLELIARALGVPLSTLLPADTPERTA